MRRAVSPAVAVALCLCVAGAGLISGCGGSASGSGSKPELVVFGAASLGPAFELYANDFSDAQVRFSFAGSDDLAAQIRQGVAPDVYAAANTALPEDLHSDGLAAKPTTFATNRLVLAVPAGSSIDSVAQIEQAGVSIAIGDPDVPIGSYTREVLARLGAGPAKAIEANVESSEPDVSGIVGKLTQGAVDAGFVYASDVVAAGDRLVAIDLPGRLQPDVAYGATVVDGADQPELAQRFIDGLLNGPGAAALRSEGFGPPPGG